MTTVLPNIYGPEQLHEFAAAAHVEPLTDEERARVAELYARNFDLDAVWPSVRPPRACRIAATRRASRPRA